MFKTENFKIPHPPNPLQGGVVYEYKNSIMKRSHFLKGDQGD